MSFGKKLSSRRVVYVIYKLSVIVSDPLWIVISVVGIMGRTIKRFGSLEITVEIINVLYNILTCRIGNADIIEVSRTVKIVRMLANNVDISNPDTR